MGKLKNHRDRATEAAEKAQPRWYDLSGVIFEREPRKPPQRLNLTRLSRQDAAVSRCVWECIKRRKPALAALLQDKPLHDMRAFFNGEISIDLE